MFHSILLFLRKYKSLRIPNVLISLAQWCFACNFCQVYVSRTSGNSYSYTFIVKASLLSAIISNSGNKEVGLLFLIVTESGLNFCKFSTDFNLAILLCRSSNLDKMNGFFCSQWPSALLIFDLLSVGCFFLFDSLALLNQELKVKFIASAIARYSSQQNKPIVRKLLSNLRKESILEILSTALCDI